MRTGLIDGKIAEHQGRIVKLTGDGILAEFPSVVNAVACATEMQRGDREREHDVPQNRRIQFRIGVNLGDVIVEGDDIYGDGVNVAARLESVGQIPAASPFHNRCAITLATALILLLKTGASRS